METMTQAQIDALLKGGFNQSNEEEQLNDMEMDAIGEIGNISMGTSATTLSQLLNRTVLITTPRVSLKSIKELYADYPTPNVAMEIEYIQGLKGKNMLIMLEEDVKIITDLLLGGPGIPSDDPIGELHISAIGEVMNQMIGSSSTALSEMFSLRIDISPPRPYVIDFNQDLSIGKDRLVVVLFRMVIEGIGDTDFMLLMPVAFAKMLISMSIGDMDEPEPAFEPEPAPPTPPPPQRKEKPVPKQQAAPKSPINVSRIQYEKLSNDRDPANTRPLDILRDVPLEIRVEIGKAVKTVKEVLELGMGSIIELNRLAGDDVDIILNGRYIAKGEVVVVDDSYGVRITEIIEE